MPPHEVVIAGFEGGGEREHRRQREPVVEAGLEVERVPNGGRYPLVGHDPRGEHRVGRGQQGAEQQRLGPAQPHHARATAAPPRSPSPACPPRGGAGAPASDRAAARPRPRGRRGTGSRSAPTVARSLTKLELAWKLTTPVSPSTKPASTYSAASDRKLRCASTDTSAPITSSPPSAAAAVWKEVTGVSLPRPGPVPRAADPTRELARPDRGRGRCAGGAESDLAAGAQPA